ncbi:class I SAM-dependent methyltransferase [Paenibacillus albicereus]|uniref:Class I SAM-dependent methyltransferase n=1 Tax=Paenibacillus albicereus TaxID=2726185 RepID=A0A6H2H2F0_9BACL|nr:class I SAM-dependent methyltransferase [Paenibacillus albicereus]QJC53874.1 class I SAM-dependent methyltransferase [Paenibacillus albicereus]
MEFTGERVIEGEVSADLFHEHISRYKFAARLLAPGSSVLDAGCGTGYGTYELSLNQLQVLGVDISSEAVEYATKRYASSNLRFETQDCSNLELDIKFDAVVSFEVIEHIQDTDGFLASIKPLLKEKGKLIISTPNKKMYSDAIEGYENPYHVREYYLDEYVELLQRHFSYVRIFTQDFMQGICVRDGNELAEVVYLDDAYQKEDSSFFIAICSDDELPPIERDVLFPLSSNNILAEKDRYISVLKQDVQARDSIIAHFKKSEQEQVEWNLALQEDQKRLMEELQFYQQQERHWADTKKLLEEAAELARKETLARDESVYGLRAEIKELYRYIELLKK